MRRKGRLAARTVRLDLMTAIDLSGVKEFFQCPPDRFDILRCTSDISGPHVNPIGHAFGHRLPTVFTFYIGINEISAFGNELFDAILDNIMLMLKSVLAFDGDLDRQPVRIPSGLTL